MIIGIAQDFFEIIGYRFRCGTERFICPLPITGCHEKARFICPLPITGCLQHEDKGIPLNAFPNRRARQRCFWLLAFISRPQVRNIHLSGRTILPGSLIPSHKYFLKNLTFVVRISTRVATSPFQSNSLQEEVVMTSRPVGQEGRCSLVVCLSKRYNK